MRLTGKLEDFSLPEVLQLLAVNAKSGRLSLSHQSGAGVVVLRNGRLIYASANSVRESFGNILLRRGLIDEATLHQALERHHRPGERRRLGAILVEMGVVGEADLAQVMLQQTGAVLAELLEWENGFFSFEPLEIPEGGEIEVDAREFLFLEGLATNDALLEALSHSVDAESDAAEPEAASLGDVIEELRGPTLGAEVTLALLDEASQAAPRGVLFLVRGRGIEGVGHFGLPQGGTAAAEIARGLRFSLRPGLVLSEPLETQQLYRGRLERTPANDRLVRSLTGAWPTEVVIVPMVVSGAVGAALYADDQGRHGAIGATRTLEQAVQRAAEEIERASSSKRATAG